MQDTFSNGDLLFIDEKSMVGQKNYNIHHAQETPPGDTPTPQDKSFGNLSVVCWGTSSSCHHLFDKAITFTELVRQQ